MHLINRFFLKYFVRYNNEKAYWSWRWFLSGDRTPKAFYENIKQLMVNLDCHNILDVGCGATVAPSVLQNYLGLDFSVEALNKNADGKFLFADVTEGIPLPDKSFDVVLCGAVLLHIKPEKIEHAINEVCRVASKAVFLAEPPNKFKVEQIHCFSHNLKELFSRFPGKVVFVDGNGLEVAC